MKIAVAAAVLVLGFVSAPLSGATSAGAVRGLVPQSAESGAYPRRGKPATAAPASLSTARPEGGDARVRESAFLSRSTRHVTRRACPDHRRGLAYYRGRYAIHVQRRTQKNKVAITARKPRSCPDARYLAVVWRGRAAQARTAAELWVERHVLRDFEVRPGGNAWLRAVDEAQGPYPNTRDWLLSCSSSEGGWGRWVPNSEGSGVGGWLQFMPSTFARMFGAASFDVARRGFIVPGSAHSWYSPLGQALAGAWGVTNGRRHEWAGSGCR